MANMTGFNPEQAKQQIEDFFYQVRDLANIFLERGLNVFVYGLMTAWCSPKAKEFSEKHFEKIAFIDSEIFHLGRNITIAATQAYNYVAKSNGAPMISIGTLDRGEDFAESRWDKIRLKEQADSGVVGMNHQNVKLLVSLFKDSVNNLINGLNELPLDIAFYDPDGEMKASYRQEITKMVNTITEEANSVYADIDAALETEVNTILLAKDNAASTMAG